LGLLAPEQVQEIPNVAVCEKKEQAKKYPPGGGLNLFSWRKIEET
jgi:hypothetical protein